MANVITIKVVADTKDAEAGAQKVKRAFQTALDPATASVSRLRSSLGGLSTALTAFASVAAFKQVAQFGIDLDKSRNAMTALTGSVEKANKKLAELRELAKTSPGVTTSFATQLFNQLKAVGGIADETINKVIKSLGKLNTVFSDVGPEFARNLVQIFQQGFERSDIKEALGRVPIFEQLLEQAFGTKDPAKLRAAKDAGKLTLGGFLSGFAEGINTDPRFKNIQESLGGKLAKQFEETKIKLAELGEKILKDLLPILDKLLPVVNSILGVFTQLPIGLQAATIAFIAMPGPIVAVANAIKGLAASILGLGAAGASPAVARVLAFLGGPAAGLMAGAAVGLGINEADRMTGELNAQFAARLARQRGEVTFLDADTQKRVNEQNAALDLARKTGVLSPELKAAFAEGVSREKKIKTGLDFSGLTGAGKGKGADRFINDFGLGETEKLRHEAELARIRLSNAATVARRQALPEGIGLPRGLAATAAGSPQEIAGFPQEEVRQLAKVADELERLPHLLSDSERFMKGFADATESVGDAFEHFGNNVARAFTNVRDLFGSLKRAVLDFFNDLIGSSLQNLVKGTLGSLFGGGGGGGISGLFGNLFRTPSFAGGGGPSALGSISSIGSFFSGGGAGPSLNRVGDPFSASQFNLALPGSGGTSFLGKLSSVAGFASLFAAPALLLGGFLFGRAKQRGADEQASGVMLTEALAAIAQLKAAIASDQIDGGQARGIFESQILAQFVSGINSLKTESVRKSRLTNQVRDLRKNFDDLIPPEVAAQVARRNSAASNALTHSRLIPEFATGGTARGGLAFLHPGEKVLNFHQQAAVIRQSNPQVFERAGVPRGQSSGPFASGGTFGGGGIPLEVSITLVMGKQDQTRAFVTGGNTPQGRATIVKSVNVARTNREL